ncbi:uncharacterized protein BKA55DRAFT_598833 [Fusarium redolens]|uniref:Myb-like domain-containing protein n=1 Tax=Fusarium redolens TaxID=48865 RepID=A0A9P9G204_FUSRE|nr:uncharacterized protein BKA55DRAFT_598833 [Fusarium redolens]KAH7230630.1 hypothetical protein BKA55DRAFT_598833 [Fusarium redolens]
MTSTTSITLPASPAATNAAIWISDDGSDTEDEDDDEGQAFDDSQSCATSTSISIADHLDSTGTNHGATEPEAAPRVVAAPTVPTAQAEDALASPNEPRGPHRADAERIQQSSCEMNHILTRDISACQDVNFANPPISPESQLCLGVADGQQLHPVPNSEPGNMTIDAISNQGSCQEAQSPLDSPSVCTHYSHTASPVEVAQTPLQDSEAFVSTLGDDSMPGAHTPSPTKLSLESHQEQVLDGANCGPSDAESEASEAESGSPFEAQVSPPSQELPFPHCSRRRPSRALEMVQDKDSDVDTEGSGSEDGLDVPEFVRDEDYCPSPPTDQGHGSGDDSDDEEHHGRKRRKVSRSPHSSVRSTPTSARSSRLRRSTRRTAQLPRGRQTSACGIESPAPSQARPVPSEARTFLARFEEWPLRDVSLKRITEGDKATFQLQFVWTPDLSQPHADRSVSHPKKGRGPAKASPPATRSSGGKWTLEEENKIQRALPHRSQGTIQVRYSTKLKS